MPLQISGADTGQGIFGWWSVEEVTHSREVPVTSNHGKDKKGLYPLCLLGDFKAFFRPDLGAVWGSDLDV